MPDPLELGRTAAAQLGHGDWQMDDLEVVPEPDAALEPTVAKSPATSTTPQPATAAAAEPPPRPEQLIEAMLFAGGPPLTAELARAAVRGLMPERFVASVDALNRRYRTQRRPYAVEPRDGGFVLAVRPEFRRLREKLFGSPREVRLGPPALEVLSAVAYRQPIGKNDIDAIRGADSGGSLRQLVRLGLIAVRHRADSGGREVRYGTTPRFLHLFGLAALDELPRLGDPQQV